jgi:hypothetical protein
LLARFLLGRLAVGGGLYLPFLGRAAIPSACFSVSGGLYLPFLGRAAIPSACFSVSGEGGMKARR